MKKVLKGIGASIGYIIIYPAVAVLVVIAGSLAYGIIACITVFKTNFSLDFAFDSLSNFLSRYEMLLTFFSGLVALFVYWLIIKARKKTVRERLDLKPVSFRSLWPIIPLGIFFNLLISNFLAVIPLPEHLIEDYMESSGFLQGEITPEMLLAVVLMAPVIEEVIFRGLVFKSLLQGMPLVPALILQAAAFGLLHGQIIWICYTTVGGIIIGMIKTRYDSLYPCILFHFVLNGWTFVQRPIYVLLPYGRSVNIMLSIISFVMIILLGIIILKKTKKTKNAGHIESLDYIASDGNTEPKAVADYE